ncbi:MAG: hypothetical protein ABIK84_05110, partial [candidate division WOR-3 bacterium]
FFENVNRAVLLLNFQSFRSYYETFREKGKKTGEHPLKWRREETFLHRRNWEENCERDWEGKQGGKERGKWEEKLSFLPSKDAVEGTDPYLFSKKALNY